jgi:hypothetical protein
VVPVACHKPKDLGHSHRLWTLQLLSQHVREHCEAAGHPCLCKAGRRSVQRLLSEHELKPHRIRYYWQRQDPDFEKKMAQVLPVYQQVALAQAQGESACELVAYLSYDEKPGIQAIEDLAPDLLPVAEDHPCNGRDHRSAVTGHHQRRADRRRVHPLGDGLPQGSGRAMTPADRRVVVCRRFAVRRAAPDAEPNRGMPPRDV